MADLTGWNVMRSQRHGRWIAESPDGIIHGFRSTAELHAAVDAYQKTHPPRTTQTRKDTPMAHQSKTITISHRSEGMLRISDLRAFLDLAEQEGFTDNYAVTVDSLTLKATRAVPSARQGAQK